MIILAGKNHQKEWYLDRPKDWAIGVSENGWTNDDLALKWLAGTFDPHTKTRTIGKYRLLILDGHGSHSTAGFDQFCTQNSIKSLYMPPHSSHRLQPLDVSCFGPLKHFYGQRVQTCMRLGINHIDKIEFLEHYRPARHQALIKSNICSGFAATGLVPFNPERVLSALPAKTPTPPSTSHSNESIWIGKTPHNIQELQRQTRFISGLHKPSIETSPSTMHQAINQVIKGCEIAIQNTAILKQEVEELRIANQRQTKKREAKRSYIAKGGVLTGEQAQQLIQEAEAEAIQQQLPKKRAPPTCSNCGVKGHTRTQCRPKPTSS